jgi:preprotein translocase subunit SecB
MTPSKVVEALRVIRAVQLRNLRLVNGEFSSKVASPGEAGTVDVQFATTARALSTDKKSEFSVIVICEARILLKESAEPVVCVKAEYEVLYSLPEELNPTAAELAAFSETNGIHHAWPYFREFVQSAFTRMGLPALIIPVLRIAPPANVNAPTPALPAQSPPALKAPAAKKGEGEE